MKDTSQFRVFDNFKVSNNAIERAQAFDSLPTRAKEVYFSVMDELMSRRYDDFYNVWHFSEWENYSVCESPIEKILFVALDILKILRSINGVYIEITPQYEIEDGKKTYRVDFLVNIYAELDSEGYDEIAYQIVVECDGHEFHNATKQQVKHDNERNTALKMLGYDVLHFSGSQIYENPVKCANDILDYAIVQFKREIDKQNAKIYIPRIE